MLTNRFLADFDALRRDMDRFFESFGNEQGGQFWTGGPAVETGWTDDYLNLRLVLPGVPENSVELSVQGNHLVIRGERPAPENFGKEGMTYYRLLYGKFERTVDLPNGLDTDHVEAHLHHGLLDIRIPVSEAVKPKRIEIQAQKESAKKIAA